MESLKEAETKQHTARILLPTNKEQNPKIKGVMAAPVQRGRSGRLCSLLTAGRDQAPVEMIQNCEF
jgi:hypothetical protein